MKTHYLITLVLVLLFITSNASIASDNAHQTLSEIANVLMNYYATTQDFDDAQVLVNENDIEFGDIVAYVDPYSGKYRPGLVIDVNGEDLIIAQVSSSKQTTSGRRSIGLPGDETRLKAPGIAVVPSYAYLKKTAQTQKSKVKKIITNTGEKLRVINTEDIF
jgi:hypothetical protein